MSGRNLSTERLRLRPCTLADVDALLALWRQPEVRRYLLDDRIVERDWVESSIAEFARTAEQHGHCL